MSKTVNKLDKTENCSWYLGLDMDKTAVGWAVTDESYNLLRRKGKDLWGIRTFEEADTAADRRMARQNRRSLDREKARCRILRSYFADAVSEKDPGFFTRLDNSFFVMEDKDPACLDGYTLFNDKGFTDREYHEAFPTVYHLRSALIRDPDLSADPRLVYLAILHMYKARGHFLFSGLSACDNSGSVEAAFDDFRASAEELLGVSIDSGDQDRVRDVLSDRRSGKKKKAALLSEALGLRKDDPAWKIKDACVKAICGSKVDANAFFPDVEKGLAKFEAGSFEEDAVILMTEAIGEDRNELFVRIKSVYDAAVLQSMLDGHDFISESMIESYNKHHSDLSDLKKLVRKHGSKADYDKLFRSDEEGSYSAYVGKRRAGGDTKRRNMKGRGKDDFYKTVKGIIQSYPDCDEKEYILSEMELGTFMPKQRTKENSIIPNQVHGKELHAILQNAMKHHAFLGETDSSGLTTAERIEELFAFKIPFFIGPVSGKSKNGWAVRKEPGRIYPWNIEDKIDFGATREAFIKGLVRDCTYIGDWKVLPSCSLLYEDFMVLNEINVLCVNGKRLDNGTKNLLFNKLSDGKKLSRKQLFNFLKDRCDGLEAEEQITGADFPLKHARTSYSRYRAVIGDAINTVNGRRLAESCIFLGAVYGEDKAEYRNRLKDAFSDRLSSSQINRIAGFRQTGWGRLSREFLTLNGVEKETGEVFTLINAMETHSMNLQEVLSSSAFTFKEELEARKRESSASLSGFYDVSLEGYYFSAPVRKMINQTLRLLEELIGIMGCPPKRIFFKTLRFDGVKGDEGRTAARVRMLKDLYEKNRAEIENCSEMIEIIDNAAERGMLKSKSLFLWLLQQGIDLYTGIPIPYEQLFNTAVYNRDHIYPKNLTKDDNLLNNIVLTEKGFNSSEKGGAYPVPEKIRKERAALWARLHRQGFINDEKYKRLTSSEDVSDDMRARFIAGQIVENGQAVKGVTDLLRQMSILQNTAIVYSKASNVAEFRAKYDLPKSGLVSELYHAQDAYLDIVVGNIYYTKFSLDPANFVAAWRKDKHRRGYSLSIMGLTDSNVKRDGCIAWEVPDRKAGKAGTIETVKATLRRTSPLMTRQAITGSGQIADLNIIGHDKAKSDGYMPIKASDPRFRNIERYGGYKSPKTAYFILVEHTKGNKRVRTIEAVNREQARIIEKTPSGLTDYCVNTLGLVDPSVRIPKILIQSLLRIDGFDVYLTGKSAAQLVLRNAGNMFLNKEQTKYVRALEKAVPENDYSRITEEKNIALYEVLLDKHMNGLYSRRKNPLGNVLASAQPEFEALPVKDQAFALLQIVQMSAAWGNGAADLRILGLSKSTGVMCISKDVTRCREAVLINRSVSGVYETRTDLLTI